MSDQGGPDKDAGAGGTGEPRDYDLSPAVPRPEPRKPLPGDADFVPPVPIVIKAEAEEAAAEEVKPKDPDVEKNKAMAILGYVCFLIPLIAAPNSKFARYHANQGLLVFILWMVAVIGSMFMHFGWMFLNPMMGNILPIWLIFGCLLNVIPFLMLMGSLVATVYGIICAANGQLKGLPLIGHMTLIK